MFEEGLASVMVHLNVPSLESKPNYPSSIYNVVTRASKELGFQVLFYRCFKYESGK
jgi:hypothetical protein